MELPDKTDSTERWPWRVFLCIALGLTVFFLFLILAGRLNIGQGDAAQRVLISFDQADALAAHVFQKSIFTDIWLPGHFVFQGLIIKMLWAFHCSDISVYLKALQMASVLMGMIGVLALARAAALSINLESGAAAGIALCSLPALLLLLPSTMAEMHTFGFLGVGLWLYMRYLHGGGGMTALLFSALAFLLANFMRIEVFVFSAAAGLFLFCRKRYLGALLFWTVSLSYFTAKIMVSLFWAGGQVSFMNFNQTNYSWGVGSLDFLREMGKLGAIGVYWNGPLFGLLLLLAVLLLRMSPPIPPNRNMLKPLVFWAFLLLVFCAYVAAACLAAIMNAERRYIFLGMVLCALLLAGLTGQALHARRTQHPNQTRRVRRLWLCMSLVIFGAGIAWTKPAPHSPALAEVIRWINTHKAPHETLCCDFLRFWEPTILLHTMDPMKKNTSFCYSWTPRKRPLPADHPPGPQQAALQTTALCHAYLADFHPKFVILAGPELEAQIASTKLINFHHRASYLKPYLRPGPSPDEWLLDSPYLKPGEKIRFKPVFHNGWFRVYTCEAMN